MSDVGRNDPCPCGSGKKYKKCCLSQKQRVVPSEEPSDKHFIVQIVPEVEELCEEAFDDIERGNLKSAERKAAYLDQLYPYQHKVKFIQGLCLALKEDLDEAIAYFEEAVQIFPYFSEGYFNLGSAYLKNAMLSKAVACFRQVIKIAGKDDLGREAKKQLNSLKNIIKQSSGLSLDEYTEQEELFNKAFSCLQQKQYESAISLFEQILVKEPKHVQSYGNLGIAYGMLGKREKALNCFDKALSLDPDYEPAKVNRRAVEKVAEGQKVDHSDIETLNVRYYLDVSRNND
jgi:tetratricopeptide (TPR) repeat protein